MYIVPREVDLNNNLNLTNRIIARLCLSSFRSYCTIVAADWPQQALVSSANIHVGYLKYGHERASQQVFRHSTHQGMKEISYPQSCRGLNLQVTSSFSPNISFVSTLESSSSSKASKKGSKRFVFVFLFSFRLFRIYMRNLERDDLGREFQTEIFCRIESTSGSLFRVVGDIE